MCDLLLSSPLPFSIVFSHPTCIYFNCYKWNIYFYLMMLNILLEKKIDPVCRLGLSFKWFVVIKYNLFYGLAVLAYDVFMSWLMFCKDQGKKRKPWKNYWVNHVHRWLGYGTVNIWCAAVNDDIALNAVSDIIEKMPHTIFFLSTKVES